MTARPSLDSYFNSTSSQSTDSSKTDYNQFLNSKPQPDHEGFKGSNFSFAPEPTHKIGDPGRSALNPDRPATGNFLENLYQAPGDLAHAWGFTGDKGMDFANEQKAGFDQATKDEVNQGMGKKLYNVAADALGGLGHIIGGTVGVGSNILAQVNPFDERSPAEKGLATIEGANEAIGGAFQTVSSPLDLSPTVKKVVSTPAEAFNHSISTLVQGVGVDTDSREGQALVTSLNNIAAIGTIALGGAEAAKGDLAKARVNVAETWNKYVDLGHEKVQSAMTPEISDKLVNVRDFEKTIKTQALQKIMNDKVDVPKWNSTVNAQVTKLKGMIEDVAQYGKVSVGDIHSIVNEFQKIAPKDLENPYVPQINQKISSYLINGADKQTGGILTRLYDAVKGKEQPSAPTSEMPNPQSQMPSGEPINSQTGEAPRTYSGQPGDMHPMQIDLERQARKAGASNVDIAAIRSLSPEQKTGIAQPYLEHAIKRSQDPINTRSVWSLPDKEISSFLEEANKQRQTIGKAEETAINTDLKGKTVDGSPIINAFKKSLEDMNIGIDSKGVLDFEPSDISLNSTAQSALKTIWKNLQANRTITGGLDESMQGTPLDARGLVSINRTINTAVKASEKAGLGGNELAARLSPIKDAVEESVKPVSSLYSQAKADYADIVKHINRIQDAGKYGNKANKGFSGAQILKRSLNTSDEKYTGAFDAMRKIEENHGITAPKDLPIKAYFANLAEKITGTGKPRGIDTMLKENLPASLAKNAVAGAVGKVVPVLGDLIRGSHDIGVDVNYKHFEGQIPGFKDAMDTASAPQVEAMLNVIKAPEFNQLPAESKIKFLKNTFKRIPPDILEKIVQNPLTKEQRPPE